MEFRYEVGCIVTHSNLKGMSWCCILYNFSQNLLFLDDLRPLLDMLYDLNIIYISLTWNLIKMCFPLKWSRFLFWSDTKTNDTADNSLNLQWIVNNVNALKSNLMYLLSRSSASCCAIAIHVLFSGFVCGSNWRCWSSCFSATDQIILTYPVH